MLEEPLISMLLRHKWEAFARAQFLVHLAGYLILEISQTVLVGGQGGGWPDRLGAGWMGQAR
jgi:hypothetical protein